jgi:hemerythrin-like domain-containing protein
MATGIYTLLKKDHDELKPMLKELSAGKEGKLRTMAEELKAHSEAEEKTFYRLLEKNPAMKELIAEGYKEHKEADRLSQALMKARGSKEKFTETAKQLQEAVLHHIKEEEGEMFTRARKIISRQQAFSMGEQFQTEKERMMAMV